MNYDDPNDSFDNDTEYDNNDNNSFTDEYKDDFYDGPYNDEDEACGLEPGTLASDRQLAKQGLTVIRFNSGETITQNSRGRCEDAPCCGCCS